MRIYGFRAIVYRDYCYIFTVDPADANRQVLFPVNRLRKHRSRKYNEPTYYTRLEPYAHRIKLNPILFFNNAFMQILIFVVFPVGISTFEITFLNTKVLIHLKISLW